MIEYWSKNKFPGIEFNNTFDQKRRLWTIFERTGNYCFFLITGILTELVYKMYPL